MDAMNKGRWKLVSYGSLGISNLFFANDLILFGEATKHQAEVMNEVLGEFCTFSGHIISKEKSLIYYSQNVER